MRSGRSYSAGEADGIALVLSEALSFWGGVDAASGRIIDASHPQRGECVSGRVVVMRGGRGSSSASSVLAESIRRGTAPAAIVLESADPILTVGAIVAESLYGIRCPIVVCEITGIGTGARVKVRSGAPGQDAVVEIVRPQPG